MTHLVEYVAAHFGVDPRDIISHDRKRHLVRARQVFWFVARKRFAMTYPVIAKISNRDHATIIHGVGRVLEAIEHNPIIASAIVHLMTVPCTRFSPDWLRKMEKTKPYRPKTVPPPCRKTAAPKPNRVPQLALSVVRARNDFDTGDDPNSQEAKFRASIRKGSKDLIKALRAA